MLTRQGMINASTVLPKIQALVRRPDEGEEAGYSAKYQEEYKNMSADMIDQLRQIYKWEIYLFDYPDTPFVDFSKAELVKKTGKPEIYLLKKKSKCHNTIFLLVLLMVLV